MNLGYNKTFLLLDKGFIENLGPFGLSKFIADLSFKFSQNLTGYLYHYALVFILVVAIFIIFVDFLSFADFFGVLIPTYISLLCSFFMVHLVFNQN